MSKMDGLRALREARYEQRVAAPSKPAQPAKAAKAPKAAPARDPEPEPTAVPMCGHRAISGRTCTREQGHAAKSHRYS